MVKRATTRAAEGCRAAAGGNLLRGCTSRLEQNSGRSAADVQASLIVSAEWRRLLSLPASLEFERLKPKRQRLTLRRPRLKPWRQPLTPRHHRLVPRYERLVPRYQRLVPRHQ